MVILEDVTVVKERLNTPEDNNLALVTVKNVLKKTN